MNLAEISGETALAAARCSAPVSSEVSPKQPYRPRGTSLSYMLPTVGQEARPVVVSLSPHFAAIQTSVRGHSTRTFSEAKCTNSLALREAAATVAMSPFPSMEKPATGLPVLAMPSTTFWVQPGSMPMTTHAETFCVAQLPLTVPECNSCSSPNCSRPYACG